MLKYTLIQVQVFSNENHIHINNISLEENR